jgi:hypothetical protein
MSTKQYVKSHAVSLGLVFLFLAASAFVAWYSMATQPPRKISFDDEMFPLTDETRAELRLSNVKFDAAKSRMTGEMEVYLTPNENYYAKSQENGTISDIDAEKALETMSALEKIDAVPVWFSHMQRVPGLEESRYVDVGGSDSIIKMVVTDFKDPFEIKGQGPFTWTAEPLTDSFWYPFDSYKLYVRLSISVPQYIYTKQAEEKTKLFDHYFNRSVDYMSLEFAGANLVADLKVKKYGDSKLQEDGDSREIDLYRPFLARAYTVFVIGLMAFGLVYLYFFKDIEGSAGDLLGFFVAALGTRAILLSGVDFSPVLLDYVVVFFSILATGVVFGRWIDKRLQPDNSIACPHCAEKISPVATRCPHCTGTLPSNNTVSADAP